MTTQQDERAELTVAVLASASGLKMLPMLQRLKDAGHDVTVNQPLTQPQAAALLQADAEVGKPMFWVRLCSNGMYEGPLHDAQIENIRKVSGAWTPLYTRPQQAAQVPLTDQQKFELFRKIPDDCRKWTNLDFYCQGAEDSEAFHGIGKDQG